MTEVISWFNKIEEKNKHTFIVSNIKDFYPSSSKHLLQTALELAKAKVSINEEEEKLFIILRNLFLLKTKKL